jgi:hypothetical protein
MHTRTHNTQVELGGGDHTLVLLTPSRKNCEGS